ncbi:hypothetical protein ACIP2X_00160 [Streptomyces sp. NPDC089424]|uniref:hypothetical protein n=1 Tax=Streptomyces sp. NPDC089424 TaxID=3365917 RepID=UPI003826E7AE
MGETYDRAYRRANFEEYTRWFPLHDRCHAGYDLVPAWVNPVFVTLPVLALFTVKVCRKFLSLNFSIHLRSPNEPDRRHL